MISGAGIMPLQSSSREDITFRRIRSLHRTGTKLPNWAGRKSASRRRVTSQLRGRDGRGAAVGARARSAVT